MSWSSAGWSQSAVIATYMQCSSWRDQVFFFFWQSSIKIIHSLPKHLWAFSFSKLIENKTLALWIHDVGGPVSQTCWQYTSGAKAIIGRPKKKKKPAHRVGKTWSCRSCILALWLKFSLIPKCGVRFQVVTRLQLFQISLPCLCNTVRSWPVVTIVSMAVFSWKKKKKIRQTLSETVSKTQSSLNGFNK